VTPPRKKTSEQAGTRLRADRQPLLVISPFSKSNYVDHKQTDQTSTLKFIEENWRTGGIGDASFDSRAGSLTSMFDFWHHPNTRPVLLDPTTGAVTLCTRPSGPGRRRPGPEVFLSCTSR
jgi:phospholipase C